MTAHALLTAEDHAGLRIRTDRGAALGDAVMTSLVLPGEFRQVQAEYPILFRLNAERDAYSAVALFGFESGENLFLAEDRWDARYRPLALDIQPFLIGRASAHATEKQVHVDLASRRVSAGDEGMRVFDADGRPTPFLEDIAEKLGAIDEGLPAAAELSQALIRHELLEPFALEVTLQDGSTNRLVGFHVIDEDRLRELDGVALAELHAANQLMPVFMAVASLGNFTRLIERKNARVAHG